MTDKELMTDDFVLWDNKIAQVETVWRNSHAVKLIINKETYRDAFLSDVKPIPITPEILEKNRFIKRNSPGYPGHFSYELPTEHMVFKLFAFNNSDFSFNINERAMKIEYIHELQHALRLCKINKEIKL